MSQSDVWKQLGRNSPDRATISRNLNQLSDARLLRRIDVGDHTWRFIAVDDGTPPQPGADFVCGNCGTVERLPEIAIWVPAGAPLAVVNKQVDIQVHGLCNACSEAA
jgi:Fur family transcriptional regulator, ferric uptake regulator